MLCEQDKCVGCSACYNACGSNAISMAETKEGFLTPLINVDKCIQCGRCEKACPVINAFTNENAFDKPNAYAAWILSDEIRMKSSSGGMFSALSQSILKNQGVVFGAVFSEDFKSVYHTYSEDEKHLSKMIGSKYLQSDIGFSFQDAKAFLKQGRTVLFSGTPCQINALYSYLGKDYDSLFTISIICHGVNSPKVFRKYIEDNEKRYQSQTVGYEFRSKRNGWDTPTVEQKFSNGKVYIKPYMDDTFSLGFGRHVYLRNSCAQCLFKKSPLAADLIIGDFWGIQNSYPNYWSDKGVSAFIVNTPKGNMLLDSISEFIEFHPVDIESISKSNLLFKSVKISPQRENFFNHLDTVSYKKLANKYMKPTNKFKKFIIRLVKLNPALKKKFFDWRRSVRFQK